MTVLEAQRWPTNSELIEAVFDLHVWPKRWAQERFIALDMTYHNGIWWKWREQRPGGFHLVSNVLAKGGYDYRDMPYADEMFDVIAFDPDYVAPGGRQSSTITEFNERYGLKDQYESPASLQRSINDGIEEMTRLLRPQGIGMLKCANYISSGKLWLGEHYSIQHALARGLVVEDIFVSVFGPGPQPERPDSRQQHARSNSSRLIVFRKPGRRKRRSHAAA